MNRRFLLIGIALVTAAFSFAALPAGADPVTVTVTLVGGQTVSVTADVDPCSGKVSLPSLPGPVQNVQAPALPCAQNQPPPAAAPAPAPAQGTQPQATQAQTTPSGKPTPAGSDKPQAKDKGSRQKTTDNVQTKASPKSSGSNTGSGNDSSTT